MLLFLVHMIIISSFLNFFLWSRPPWSTTQWYQNQSAFVSTMISFLFFHHLSIGDAFRSPTRQISDSLWFTKSELPPKIRLKGKIIKNLKLKTESYNNLLLWIYVTLIYINFIKCWLCTTLHTIAYYIINKLPYTSIPYIWRRLEIFEKWITACTFQ